MNCTAKTSAGNPCKARAIKGGNVCIKHGGAAPQVRKAAAIRLAILIDPSLAVLLKSLKSKNERIRLDAAKDILDRNGLKDATKIIITGPDEGPVRVEFDVDKLTDEQLVIAKQFARSLANNIEGEPASPNAPLV